MTTLQVKKPIILTGVVNWLEWLDYIGSKLELATWNAIRSGDQSFLLAEPRKPLLIDFNPAATIEANLNTTQARAYKNARSHYKEDLEAYDKQQKQLIKAREAIYSSVDERLCRYLEWNNDVYHWMKVLTGAISVE
ncbi:hypothetical protein QQS21_012935 [Conoideocrella luteorostrata]|uniref:Uncharacterized protein n=1 Tax=Conoideocrella luteorostrata TaxID=1105319 RepID=A0AAJ0CA92_9HYPO|nr:hypothetical protein QQS21_012935 [Conoideocrella luteorostrata]